MENVKKRSVITGYILITTVTFLFLGPILWALISSFKPKDLLYTPSLIFTPTIANYQEAISSINFFSHLTNSLIISVSTVLICLILGLPAAYGFVRFKFKMKNSLLFWILSIQMLPPIAAVIALYDLFLSTNLLGTHLAVVIASSIFNLPLTVWMMRSFFQEVPLTLEESAMIDGCTRIQAFFKITLPLVGTGIATTSIFVFLFSWNAYLIPLVLTNRTTQTLPVAITGFVSDSGVMWDQLLPASMLTVLPLVILAIFIQKYIVRGISFGAVK
ncbi:carbohydrate ABC transporter permease [Alteribacillus sp. YIM 98480]|uniref:carbohydrate ABC transporter permease n=1 Tax=Alteribacillus sp. YIM 98480 TaxID=2606599 RepID=UPI00131E2629|nr:carbohydrate ABC transporter permease [Alteribacillus sp. YIM 98480]